MKLHHQRMEAYEKEKKEWNEKHPESIASDKDVEGMKEESIIDDVQVRLTVHFRHLVGNQGFEFTDEQLNTLKEPLELTEDEIRRLKLVDDIDDFIDFLEKTKRNFSVKVHKTVKLKKRDLSRDNSSGDLGDKISEIGDKLDTILHRDSDDTKSRSITTPPTESTTEGDGIEPSKPTISTEGMKPTITTTSPVSPSAPTEPAKPKQQMSSNHLSVPNEPKENENSDDIFMELNENVYLQIQYIKMTEEHKPKKRRAIFIVPDPDLSDEIGEESSATWVELLGDVFYVGWLSNFTHAAEITSSNGIGKYFAWFVVMWWTWCASALYSSRYDSGDVTHHVYKIIELCGLVIMAGASPNYQKNPKWFIIGYIIMKAVNLVQYSIIFIVSLGAHFKSSRRPLGAYVAASAISIVLWGISLLYLPPEGIPNDPNAVKRYALWYISIGLELIVYMVLQTNSRVSLAASHLGERFGLFTLIILGENCMGFITTVAELNTDNNATEPKAMAAIMFSVAIIFCYFFMYFDDFSGEFVAKTKMSSLWMYLHFPLHLFQVAFGIALTSLIKRVINNGSEAVAEHASNTTAEHATTVASHIARLVASEHGSGHDSEPLTDSFLITFFWVSAGLILCFNAFIKLVNTPIKSVHYRSYIICGSRILNAVIFFALSVTTFHQLEPLPMISLMMACLFVQSAVDLLD
ncbi:hypothetical protein RMATCC62417_00251 [Rhizopus microsporus]|nr:hypothetical protein RMATCC62417_00251 [Rhizopus microsporus]